MSREPGAAPGQSVIEPTLVLQRADGSTREFVVPADEPLTLGRDASNAVVLESTFVSKRHATIGYEGGQYVVRDLKSANGTRVNGAPAMVTPIVPGDILEIGDQSLTFVDRGAGRARAAAAQAAKGRELRDAPAARAAKPAAVAAPAAPARAAAKAPAPSSFTPGGPSPIAKLIRLGAVALLFGVGLFLALRFFLITDAPPGFDTAPPAAIGASSWMPEGTTAVPPAKDSPLIQQVLAQAKTAGVKPSDALFDEAVNQYNAGRLIECARLFSATLEHEPGRNIARSRLAEVLIELEAAIAQHRAEAERLTSQLRYEDAVAEWERVLLLLEPNDPRVPAAKSGRDDVKRHLAR